MEVVKTEELLVVEDKFVIGDGKKNKGFLRVKRLHLRNKGVDFTRDKVESKDAVAAVVYDTKLWKYVFVKQYRPGPEKYLIELVAGLIDHDGLSAVQTMISEIKPELGYEVDSIVQICQPFYTTPGKTSEKMYLFFVTVSKQTEKGGGVESENEDIEIIKVTPEEVKELDIEDGKTLLGLYKTNVL